MHLGATTSFTVALYVNAPPLPNWLPDRTIAGDVPADHWYQLPGWSLIMYDRGRVMATACDSDPNINCRYIKVCLGWRQHCLLAIATL